MIQKQKKRGGKWYKMLDSYPDIMTVAELQSALSVGRSKAYALLHDGSIPYITIGRQIRIPKRNLLDFLAQMCYTPILKSGVDCRERSIT